MIGNAVTISPSLFSEGYTLTSLIVNQFNETTSPIYYSAMVEIALILFALAITINVIARVLIWRMTRGTRFRV